MLSSLKKPIKFASPEAKKRAEKIKAAFAEVPEKPTLTGSSHADMLPIPPCNESAPIPADAVCQEASMFSRNSYIPCSRPARHIVRHDKDRRSYYMCDGCMDHNIRARGGKLIASDGDPKAEYVRLKIQRDDLDKQIAAIRDKVIDQLKAGEQFPATMPMMLELTYTKRPFNSAAKILEAVEPSLSADAKLIVESMRAKKYDCPELTIKPNPRWEGGK
jgi:hypothetical protein